MKHHAHSTEGETAASSCSHDHEGECGGCHRSAEERLTFHESGERLRAILETAVDGIITIDDRGIIESLNPAAQRIFGYQPAELLGKNVNVLMPEPFRSQHDSYIKKYKQSEASKAICIGREIVAQRKDGTVFPIDLSVSEVRLGKRRLFTGFVRDITDRKRVELREKVQSVTSQALADSTTITEASRKVLQAICETMDFEIGELWQVDRTENLLRYVGSWTRPGLNADDFQTQAANLSFRPGIGVPGRIWQDRKAEWFTNLTENKHFARAEFARREGLQGAFAFPIFLAEEIVGVIAFFTRENRKPDPLLAELFGVLGNQIGQFFERKRLEQEISHVSEIEKRCIGQDLHDGICQQLAGIELMSQVLEHNLEKKSKNHAAQAGQIARHVREAIAQTRSIARGLLPVVVESEGLMAALQELAASTGNLFRTACRFQRGAPVLISNNVAATHLYRIAQEAVSNALRHGKAAKIEIALVENGETIELNITDNGVGFGDNVGKKGMGLRIMQYRAGMLGGSLTVQSSGRGTSITCSVPKRAAEQPGNRAVSP